MRLLLYLYLISTNILGQDSGIFNEEIFKRTVAICRLCQNSLDSNDENTFYYKDFHKAHIDFQNKQLSSAHESILNAIELLSNKNQEATFYSLLLKAEVLDQKSLFKEAISSYQDALKLSLHKIDAYLLSYINSTIASIYLDQNKFEEALSYFKIWEQINQNQESCRNLKVNFHSLGLCHFHLGNYKDAERYLKKSQALSEEQQDTLALAISHMDIGNLYYEQYLDAKAIPYFKQGLLLAEQAGDIDVLHNAYFNMSVVHENLKEYSKALDYRKAYEALHDSIWNRDKVKELYEQEKQLALTKKEFKINGLEQQTQLQQAELQTRNWQRNTFLSTALALFLLLCISLYFYKKGRQKNKIISVQKETLTQLNATKDRLFSIVAHDLRSPMRLLKKTQQQLQHIKTPKDIHKFRDLLLTSQSITDRTFTLLDNLLFWALSQTRQLLFNKESLHLYAVTQQVLYNFEPLCIEKNIRIEQHIPEHLFILADLNTLKIILRNLIDNALKFTSSEGTIRLSAKEKIDTCEIIITDTGSGIDPATVRQINNTSEQIKGKGTGLGLWLCRDLIQQHQGGFYIKSELNKGTTITITLEKSQAIVYV